MRTSVLANVRRYCLWCMNGQEREVNLCTCDGIQTDKCSLYDLRFGRRDKKINVLKAIKERCKNCCEHVRTCEFPDCQLFIYRTGHNPKRIRNSSKTALRAIKSLEIGQSKGTS